MPLDRFTNQEEILNTDGLVRGVEWRKGEYEALALDNLSVSLTDVDRLETELYVYTPQTGQYITGGITDKTNLRDGKLYIDYAGAIADFGIERGPFEVVVNIHQPVIGDYDNPILLAKEVSPDRREVLVTLAPSVVDNIVPEFLEEFDDAFELDLALNFGENRVYKIINFKRWRDDSQLAIRLYQPLPEDIELNSPSWIVEQLSDSFVDNVDLSVDSPEDEVTELRGPNFEIDANYATITETDFKSWNELLDANLSTSQQIVDKVFSGSLAGVELGIDYSGFQNFVFYSSATERVDNFKYKLELIEFYNNRINQLDQGSNTDDGALQGNIATARKRRDAVIGGFDNFERYLYNESTASLFTEHPDYTNYLAEGGFIGAKPYRIQPWPKYLSDGKYVLHTVESTLGTNWYNNVRATASLYDNESETALVKTIPEHIRLDTNNDQYELFVNMIGQHFDILYTYVDALTKTYKPQEHPKLGRSKEILYDVAESLGWKLTNGNQASALWQYTLGVDSGSGAYAQTGSIFSKSNEDITTEVWRRIVNNLPYILKTRGTDRSVKALMNAYGIPQTLLSVREYGGPKVSGDAPALIEDRFSYALQINEDAHIIVPCGNSNIRTREIRFKPAIKDDMALMSFYGGVTTDFHVAVLYTGSYSGSDSYGRIAVADGDASSTTDFLPLYDGQFWNLRWTTDTSNNNIVKVQAASDYITGKVIHSGSTGAIAESIFAGGPGAEIYIGGRLDTLVDAQINALSDTEITTFSGSVQEYREWTETITDDTFNFHTLNPTSYVASSDPTASYDKLHRHLPLGTDLDAIDLSTNGTKVMSKHPASGSAAPVGGEATVNGFSTPENAERGNFEPVEETYYIQGISLGANNPRSEKIRLENNELIRRLSPTNTAERSSFDFAPIDSNKLGLFYSQADQINKDIFNHVGDVELDDYVGDPDDEYAFKYDDLHHFSKEYWKKFANKNDVNAFIRIFSQFDFSLFNQIRQLLPERIDEAMGILVEPHALERAKEILTKRPTVTNPQYSAFIPEPVKIITGSLPMYEGAITSSANIITMESLYHTVSGSNGYGDMPGNYIAQVGNASNSGSTDFSNRAIYPLDQLPGYTSSLADYSGDWAAIQGDVFIDDESNDIVLSITSTAPKTVIFEFNDALSQFETIRDVTVRMVHASSALGRLHADYELQYNDNGRYRTFASLRLPRRLRNSYLTGPDYNTPLTFKDIVFPIIDKPIRLKVTFTSNNASNTNVYVRFIELHHKIKRVNHEYLGRIVEDNRTSDIFDRVVNHFSGSESILDKKLRNNDHWVSQSLGLYYSQSLTPASYRDDFFASVENPYYEGCKITGPGVNQPTTIAALGNKPVIEVYEANANQLIYTVTPEPVQGGSKLIVPPGNINVR